MQPTSPSRRRHYPARPALPRLGLLPFCDRLFRDHCPAHCPTHCPWRTLLLVVIFSLAAQALLPRPVAAQLIPQRQWAVFRQSQGLLSNDAHAILIDGSTIWFGTDKGVNRYDGRWQSFPISLIGRQADRRRNPATPGAVVALAKPLDGQGVWLATEHGYVARWDGERWAFITALDATIYDIADIEGTLWLATSQGLALYDGAQVRTVTALHAAPVYDLYRENDTVWVGAESGLWRLSPDAAAAEHVPVAVIPAADDNLNLEEAIAEHAPAARIAGPIRALWGDGAGALWFGVGLQVVQFDPRSGVGLGFRPFEERTDAYWITAIAGKPGESLWVTSNGAGVVHYMFADGKLAATSNLGADADGGLDADDVRALALDQDSTVWFSTPVGVFRYQQWAWLETAGAYDGLSINDVLSDRNGALWVATNGEGVQRRQSLYANVETFYPYDTELPSENVLDLEEDPQGRIWAATAAGLAVFADGRWTTPVDAVRLPSPQVTAIKADKHALWIGTPAGLLRYVFASGRLQSVPDFEGQAIGRLELDLSGRLWVAPLLGGLWLRTLDGQWLDTLKDATGGPPATQVTALLADPHQPGGMYAAFMNGGIYNWTGDAWASIDRRRWPQGDRIQVLALEPSDDSLWIGSEIGLSRLDGLSLITYDSHDGMQNGAIRAIARQPDGGYWFGGQKGLSHYNLERTPPWVRVSGVASEGAAVRNGLQTVYAGHPVEISYLAGDIQSAADELRIFYRIKHGAAVEPWHEVRNGSFELRFNAAGAADIEIMARDQSFNYSQPQVLTLAVLPPPVTVLLPMLGQVEERIFRLLLLFAGLALLGFGYVSFEIFQHNRRVTDAVRRGFNPYISGEPVRRGEMFFGRHNLLDRIVSTLHNNSIMIHGERRIGKTTLLYQIANVLRQVNDTEFWFLPVMIDLEGTAETQLFPQLIDEIVQAVELLPALSASDDQSLRYLLFRTTDLSQYTDREFGRDLRTLIRMLEDYSVQNEGGRQVRLIMLLDEGDTLSNFNHIYQQQLRRIFMRDFAATLGAVVAGIQISKEWDRVESPWYNLFNEIAMAPFTRAQAIELLVEPVRGYYLYEPDAIEYILDLSDGRPFRIQQYALEAVNHMLKEKRRRILRRDVEFAHEQLVALSAAHADGTGVEVPDLLGPNRVVILPAPDTRLLGSAAD